jgi:Outer membrane protein beta-barrel domain
MKKIILFAFTIFCVNYSFSQGEGEKDKNFRFGLQVTPAVQWFKIDGSKKIESDGVKFKGGFGLNTDFRITDVIWFNTGFNLFYDGGKIAYKDTVKYFFNTADEVILSIEDGKKQMMGADSNKLEIYKLNSRTYNSTNIQIPLMLRLRTKDIGGMRYFGQFGLNANIRLRGRATDIAAKQNGLKPSTFASESTKESLNITSDVNIFNLGLAVGAGAEYNLSGSTSIFGALNFVNLGFTNFAKSNSNQLFTTDGNNNKSGKYPEFAQKFLSRGVTLSIGILF